MSKNIKQIFDANPSTTAADGDLFYMGKSPFGIGDDSAMQFSYLQKNLFQNNRLASSQEFGQGGGSEFVITNASFSGGQYVLTNPCPNIVVVKSTDPLNNKVLLPPAQGTSSFNLFNGPAIHVPIGFEPINVTDSGGTTVIAAMATGQADNFYLSDNSTMVGGWYVDPFVESINGISGQMLFTAGANMDITENGDGTITFSAISGPSAVTSGQCNLFILANVTNTTFAGTGIPTKILSGNLHVLNQTNFLATLVGGTPNIQFLTTAARRIKIDACFTVRTSSVLTQTYTLYLSIVNGATVTTTGAISSITVNPTGSPGPQEISLTYNLSLTGSGDSLQFYISNDSATTDPVIVTQGAITILDTTQFGGFTSTDNLPQGTTNKYLSIDGGTTYQNVTGAIVSGHIPSFSGTGGLLADSGIPTGQVVRTVGNQSIAGTKIFTDPTFALIPSSPGDGSSIIFENSTYNVTNGSDQGAGVDIYQEYFAGTSATAGGTTYFWSTGFNYENAGGDSGYFFSQILNKGVRNTIFQMMGGDATNGNRVLFGGSSPSPNISNLSIGLSKSDNPHLGAVFEIASTTQGVLISRMTNAQMNSINVSDTPTGLLVYTNDAPKGLNYWDGSWNLIPAISSSAPLSATLGGTGVSNPTAHSLPVAEGSSAFTFLGPLTNGQMLIGSTGANPVAATISAGTGVTVSTGAGSLTISATGGGPYTEVTGTSQAMAVNNEYTANNAGLVTLTLPATAAIGDYVIVNGLGAGGWKIAQNASQTIHAGSSATTVGVGGSLASTNRFDSIKLKCVVANTTWIQQWAGNLTTV